MPEQIQFSGENQSNSVREVIANREAHSLRTFTPSQAVLARSAGVFHWTPEGRRLYDYSSGVLVANLGHNPARWLKRFAEYLGWNSDTFTTDSDYVNCVGMTAYNAITEVEAQAADRLVASVQEARGGQRMNKVIWSASGSEAVQKALWACLFRDPERDMIIATRYGFHGKKGLAGAVTGSETDLERDDRVRFVSFPMDEIDDISNVNENIDLTEYRAELDALHDEFGSRLTCLITEPYLGGGGSYHPPAAYLQMLQDFCREHDLMFVIDEVQSNFGRTGEMYAFEKYGLEPDFVTLGKGMGNGVPVSAVVGRADVIDTMNYGVTSDTWSANPISCAAVLATLDEFESTNILERTRELFGVYTEGLIRLKETGIIGKVRGEGMVFGIQCNSVNGVDSKEVANRLVETCYLGQQEGDGIHLLGPLAGDVVRISPPMTITDEETTLSLQLLFDMCARLYAELTA